MKKIYIIILSLIAINVACTKEYKERYDAIKADYTFMTVGSAVDTIPLMVYYSGPWKAIVEEGVEWLSVDQAQGKGISILHFMVERNRLEARSAALYLVGGLETLTISIEQKAGVGGYDGEDDGQDEEEDLYDDNPNIGDEEDEGGE